MARFEIGLFLDGFEFWRTLTADDLDAYAVVERAIDRTQSRSTLYVPPAPAAGGQMVGLMRRLVSRSYLSHPGDDHRAPIDSVPLWLADEARVNGSIAVDGSEFEALEKSFTDALHAPLNHAPTASGGPPSTTHVSVIDGNGNAAALTTSYGESNGLFIGETGILMNNFLGEDDLLPLGLGTEDSTGNDDDPQFSYPTKGMFSLGTGGQIGYAPRFCKF